MSIEYLHGGLPTETNHLKLSIRDSSSIEETYIEKLIPYKGSLVLAVQKHFQENGGTLVDYVLVPGRVLSREGRISKVEPITDRTEREDLTKILEEENFKGPINFW